MTSSPETWDALILFDGPNIIIPFIGLTMSNVARWHLRWHILLQGDSKWCACRSMFKRAVCIRHFRVWMTMNDWYIIINSKFQCFHDALSHSTSIIYISFMIIVTSCNFTASVGREVLAAQRAIMDRCRQPRDGATGLNRATRWPNVEMGDIQKSIIKYWLLCQSEFTGNVPLGTFMISGHDSFFCTEADDLVGGVAASGRELRDSRSQLLLCFFPF